ncbi:hypothetical protein [Rickettsia australis]|uniref:Uncharacterized protein n=1 Tax=Rickettsia australis (strain Cutlack) TaxID=1105110 RepID=H8K737_RICAC|nr:hypothetical protein [Rickettsia australis]AFC71080.1 hypothetical protein MC5_03780 [Rickettsia australis str. Cutlack]
MCICLSRINTNTDKIKHDNDDVKNSKNELLSSSIEEELVFSRPVLPTDNESPRKSSSLNTNKRKHSSSEKEELTLSDSEDEALNSSVNKQLSKKPKASNFGEVMPILFELAKT